MPASAPPSPPLADATALLDAAVARLEDAARQAHDNAVQAPPPPDPGRAAALSEATDRLDALMLRLNAALAQQE
jgi:hypothetical protein